MKIMSLNLWGGRVSKELLSFISEKAGQADILCFQEVFQSEVEGQIYGTAQTNLFAKLQALLPDHTGYFVALEEKQGEEDLAVPADHAGYEFVKNGDPLESGMVDYGQAIFVRNNLEVLTHDHLFVYKYKNRLREVKWGDEDHGRALQWMLIKQDGDPLVVANIHGFWHKSGKSDTPERIEQSKKILETLRPMPGRKVICGDFNLAPDTESVRMIEAAGFRNLVTEAGVLSTRSGLHTGPVKFADYIFVDSEAEVKHFEVMDDQVSDHLPLLVEIG